jgi:hypothetical protein
VPHHLGPAFTAGQLREFEQQVRGHAERGEKLGGELRQAHALYRALFTGDVSEVLARLRESAGKENVLLRLMLHQDSGLHAFPWEALCEPETTVGFLGSSSDVLLARGVNSKEPRVLREVRGAVRVLAISPLGESYLMGLRAALEEGIVAGEVEWLEPLHGSKVRLSTLVERLHREPVPHIIHFLGHGGLSEDGAPALRLADEDGEARWLKAELLAQYLRPCLRTLLRLVVLEACEGARRGEDQTAPGMMASAAERLVSLGADAVIAHLWPVSMDIARDCSKYFYRALTRKGQHPGDVAQSLSEARSLLLGTYKDSAEVFSPVLYLRGKDSVLFDFRQRKLTPPPPEVAHAEPAAPASPLLTLLEEPVTLVLGDRWKDERHVLDGLRERLRRRLTAKVGAVPPSLSMSALAQHYAMRFGDQVYDEFQEVFGSITDSLPLVQGLARKLRPGIHITLLRLPVLELALAEFHPEFPLYAVHPPYPLLMTAEPGQTDLGATVMKYERAERRWKRLEALPETLDPEQSFIVLRLYRGYRPPNFFANPLMTEDDYLLGISELDSILPQDLAVSLRAQLFARPTLLMGMSMLTWHHRMLLYRLFGDRGLPAKSLVVLEPGEHEQDLWIRGRNRPVRQGVRLLELGAADLIVPFQEPPHLETP